MSVLLNLYKTNPKIPLNKLPKEVAINIQEVLIWHQLLQPPADGLWGPKSNSALATFKVAANNIYNTVLTEQGYLGPETIKALIQIHPKKLKPYLPKVATTLIDKIVAYYKKKEYLLNTWEGNINIAYVEGMNINGTLNDDKPNYFNDIRLVFTFKNNKPIILGIWEATTEPGRKYTIKALNPNGAARIQFGQYAAWRVGYHKGNQLALVQVLPLPVCRDLNKDYKRRGDRVFKGLYGINQHAGYNMPNNNIGAASAGCLVGRTNSGHKEFMDLIMTDVRYRSNRRFLFPTAVIPGRAL